MTALPKILLNEIFMIIVKTVAADTATKVPLAAVCCPSVGYYLKKL